MPFVFKKFNAIQGQKIQHFLINEAGLSLSLSQKLLSKKRVFNDQHQPLNNGHIVIRYSFPPVIIHEIRNF